MQSVLKKSISCILVCLGLVSFNTNAQERVIQDKEWENIVNYVNSKVTLAYIKHLKQTKNLPDEDLKEFNENIETPLEKNNIQKSLAYSEIEQLLKDNFDETLNNLSYQINSSVNFISQDTLFNRVKRNLNKVNAGHLYLEANVNSVKKEVENYINQNFQLKRSNNNKIQPTKATQQQKQEKPYYSWSILGFILAFVFGVLTIILFFKNKRIKKENKRIKKENKDLKKENKDLEKENKDLEEENKDLKEENKRIKERNKNLEETEKLYQKSQNRNNKKSRDKLDSNQNNKYTKTNTQSVEKKKQHGISDQPAPTYYFDKQQAANPVEKTFYAGKPTPNKEFSNITNSKDPQTSIFKLVTTNETQTKAEFEVIIASDFMEKNITNMPDDYLFRVCNHENSNQDFRREIITTKKGIAELVNDKWHVTENNKAIIKFQ